MLVWHVGECMVSIININLSFKEHIHRYQDCNTSQILMFGWYVKARESLYTQVIIWVYIIMDLVDTWVILFRHEGCCIVYRVDPTFF